MSNWINIDIYVNFIANIKFKLPLHVKKTLQIYKSNLKKINKEKTLLIIKF